MWVNTLIAQDLLTKDIERWMGISWNTLSDVYSRAMDGDFASGLHSGADYIAPSLHRLLGGHTPADAWRAINDALPDLTLGENFIGMIRALASDMSSPIGLPIVTLTRDTVRALQESVASIGIPKSWLNDALHFNALEMAASAVPVLALLFDWGEDRERFARHAGSLAVGAAIGGNPIGVLVSLVILARSYSAAKKLDGRIAWAKAVTHGGAISGVVLASSALIAGPAWVGLTVGIVLAMLLAQHGRRIPAKEIALFVRQLVRLRPALSPQIG